MLIKLARASDGAYQLWFRDTPLSAPPDVTADAVVLAIPFTTLRRITLDPSLGLPAAQQAAIANLGYGVAGKNIVGFNGRPWAAHGSNGACYSDQADLQNTWETNWSRAGATAVLTDFFGGDRAAALQAPRSRRRRRRRRRSAAAPAMAPAASSPAGRSSRCTSTR
jgi:monoamine oxidase